MIFYIHHIEKIKKRRYIFVVVLALTVFPLAGQKSKADRLFADKQYYAAAQIYEEEVGNAKPGNLLEIQLNIGLCYLNINRPQKALPWLERAAKITNSNGETWYQYGLALQQTGDYRKAIKAFERCLQLQGGHPWAASKIASCRFAIQNSPINPYANFRLANEINTSGSEFGVSPYTNNILYYSVAGAPSGRAKIDQRTGLQYTESYMARTHKGLIVNPQAVDHMLPRFITSGLFAYDSIAHCTYFAYCDPDNNTRCGIFSSQLKGDKWSNPEMVIQNKRNQVTDHPSISNGGKRLYFSSNSTEGFGKTDIWYVDKGSDGKWGKPVNVGNVINTPGREEFPFVYADSLLFFASDGHMGYGGLDIFCSAINGNTFSPPINLRRPYNSHGDDFNMVIHGKSGLMSSSRNELVSDDIYLFDGIPWLLYLSGYVTDASSGQPVGDARLTLSVDGKAMHNTISDSTGYYGFFLKDETSSMIYTRASGYKSSLTEAKVNNLRRFADFRQDIKIHPINTVPVTVSLYDKITNRPVIERGIICYNNDGETQIVRTDANGTFKLVMQEGQREYWIKFPDGYYLTESVTLAEGQNTYSLGVQPLNNELFSEWLRFKKGSTEPIEMSQPLIPRIASIIKANPGMVFQITGFTDMAPEARQTDLARKRAEYIMGRMVEEGVNQQQLIVSERKDTPNNQPLNEEQLSAKRRVEFRIKR